MRKYIQCRYVIPWQENICHRLWQAVVKETLRASNEDIGDQYPTTMRPLLKMGRFDGLNEA